MTTAYAQSNVTAVNTFGPTGLLSRNAGAGLNPSSEVFYLFTPFGDVAKRLVAGAQVTSTDRYDAWGNRNEGSYTGDPFGYKGQYGYYTDHDLKLILCTNRYYDPAYGRWVTRDPIGYEGGINLYGYCSGNPVDSQDPLGLEDVEDVINQAEADHNRRRAGAQKAVKVTGEVIQGAREVTGINDFEHTVTGEDYLTKRKIPLGERIADGASTLLAIVAAPLIKGAALVDDAIDAVKTAKTVKKVTKAANPFKELSENFLRSQKIDPHDLKYNVLGKKAKIAEYDIHQNTTTKQLFLIRKLKYRTSKDMPIPTEKFLK